MKAVRQVLLAVLSGAILASGSVLSAPTTDFSDQWWVPTESGWGASIHQQADKMFIDLLVYGADGKPTWFSAAAPLQSNAPPGHTVFLGDLYATTGPYYGSVFSPASVTMRRVGTLTFDATSVSEATLSYVVDGVPVAKSVTRQTWRYEHLGGRFVGGMSYDTACNWGFDAMTIDIDHDNDNNISIVATSVDFPGYWNFIGTYSQTGHLGRISARLAPTDTGTVTFTEIENTTAGFTARFSGTMNGCVITDGRFGGVRR